MKKTKKDSKRLQANGGKKNKKVWITSGILAGVVAVSVGAGVACIPQKTHVDPAKGLDVGKNATFDHDVKQNFLAGLMQDVETGLVMSNINVGLKTEVKGQKINIEVRNGSIEFKKPANGDMYVKTDLPLLLDGSDTVVVQTTLNNGELFFSLNDFDENGKKANVKYKIHVGKDESTRKFYTDEHGNKNSKFAPTEFDNYIDAVKECFGMAKKEKDSKKDSPLNLSFNWDKILAAVWGIDVMRNPAGEGYVGYINIPIELANGAKLLEIPLRLDFSNQYHLRGITAPATKENKVANYITLGGLPQPMGDVNLRAAMSVMNKDLKPADPKNADQYTPLVDSLKFIKKISKLTKSTNFGFDLDLAVSHEVDPTTTEEATIRVNGDAKLKQSIMASGKKIETPEFVTAGILMRVHDLDKDGIKHYYDQKLQASYKNDNIYVEYNDSTRIRLAKSLLDQIIPQQVKEAKGTSVKVAGEMSSIEKALRSMQDKAIIAGVVRAIDDAKKVGTSDVMEGIKGGAYGEIKDLVDNITLDSEKTSIVLDLTNINLAGKIKVTIDPIDLLTIEFLNVKGLGFGLNGKFKVSDKEEIKVKDFNNDDYYEIYNAPGTIAQFTQLAQDKKLTANVKASMFNADGTLEDIKNYGGFTGDIKASLNGNTKEAAADAYISWYQLDKFTKKGATEPTVLPRRHDFEIKADITDHNDVYDPETKTFKREEFGTKAFMSINDFEYDLVNDKPLNKNTTPFKARLSGTSINDFVNFGKKVAAINDIRISTILDMIKKNHAESVITSIINNHLNNMIKYPIVSGTSYHQTAEHLNDSYTISLNKEVMGLDKNLDVTATFVKGEAADSKSMLKALNVSTVANIDKLGGKQKVNFDITLDEYKPVEECWNFSKQVDIEVPNPDYVEPTPVEVTPDEEVDNKLELLRANDAEAVVTGEDETPAPSGDESGSEPKGDEDDKPSVNTTDKYLPETVVKGDHQLNEFVDIDSLSLFLDYGLNTAMFGCGTRYEQNADGEYVAIKNLTGANTYHVKFATKPVSTIVAKPVNPIKLEFDLHFSKKGIEAYGTFAMPIFGAGALTKVHEALYNNPIEGQSGWINKTNTMYHGGADDRYITTTFAYQSNAKDENNEAIEGGAFYLLRDADYSKGAFKDARKVKFNDLKANAQDWVMKYMMNSYISLPKESQSSPFVMKRVTSFLGGYTYDPSTKEFNFTIGGLKSINSMLNSVEMRLQTNEKSNVFYNSDIKINTSLIAVNANLALTNITKDGKYVETWTENVENSMEELISSTSGLAWSTTPYTVDTGLTVKPSASVYNKATCERITKRDGLVETVDGTVMSYTDYIQSRETPRTEVVPETPATIPSEKVEG